MNIKTISTVLLSADHFYVSDKWKLPSRYKWDKEFITNLCFNKKVLMSPSTLRTIPDSILKVCSDVILDPNDKWDINFWIDTFKYDSDMFIIIFSDKKLWNWKKFNFDSISENYDLIMDMNNICIYFNKKV